NAAHGERVVAGSMRLDGRPIELDGTYRVTVNNFLAEGGDGFRVLREATDRAEGSADIDALLAYLSQTSSTQPLVPDRISRIGRR
ncbi:MAG TPA: 5'-nucleotidase C-terminal domain-containing protein, partial [Burkholderiaceae bacterium]|nr:5'-nucleotidase C-terminal domain-containing protein [Burkholderiaceae bacterium]